MCLTKSYKEQFHLLRNGRDFSFHKRPVVEDRAINVGRGDVISGNSSRNSVFTVSGADLTEAGKRDEHSILH